MEDPKHSRTHGSHYYLVVAWVLRCGSTLSILFPHFPSQDLILLAVYVVPVVLALLSREDGKKCMDSISPRVDTHICSLQ